MNFLISLKNKFNMYWALWSASTVGVNEILSSDSSTWHVYRKKLKQAGHQLGNNDKTGVIINPQDDYLIKPNEGLW